MAKRNSRVFNPETQKRITIQIREYDSDGNYLPKTSKEIPLTQQVKGVETKKVQEVILEALNQRFGDKNFKRVLVNKRR